MTILVGGRATGYVATPATSPVAASSTYAGQTVSVQAAAGSFTKPVSVEINTTASPANAAAPAGTMFAGANFDLIVETEDQVGVWNPVTTVAGGLTVTVAYTGPADAASLALYRWNSATSAWVDAATECSPASAYDRSKTGQIAVKVCKTGSFALAGKVQASITANGVTNGASFASTSVAPGAIVAIFGSNLAGSVVSASTVPLPTTLGGVRVLINGTVAAPIYYVSPGQINIQLPFDTAVGSATAAIVRDGTQGPALTFNVVAAGPGIFGYGDQRAIAVNNDDGKLNAGNAPAKVGSALVVYLTGPGAVDNPPVSGSPASSTALSRVQGTVTATIGGKDAQVLFAGLAPGWIGLAQVNLVVPAVAAGDEPLVITVNGKASNMAYVTVRP